MMSNLVPDTTAPATGTVPVTNTFSVPSPATLSSVPVRLKEAVPVRELPETVSVKSGTGSKSSAEAIPLPSEPVTDTVTGRSPSNPAEPARVAETVTAAAAPVAPSVREPGPTPRLTSGKASLSSLTPM